MFSKSSALVPFPLYLIFGFTNKTFLKSYYNDAFPLCKIILLPKMKVINAKAPLWPNKTLACSGATANSIAHEGLRLITTGFLHRLLQLTCIEVAGAEKCPCIKLG